MEFKMERYSINLDVLSKEVPRNVGGVKGWRKKGRGNMGGEEKGQWGEGREKEGLEGEGKSTMYVCMSGGTNCPQHHLATVCYKSV